MDLVSAFNKIKSRIRNCYFEKPQEDGKDYYIAQVSSFNQTSISQVYYPYGYYAVVPEGSLGVQLSLNLHEENKVCFPYSTQYRFTGGKKGEVITGNPISKVFVHFKNNGDIEITSTSNLIINCQNAIINGNLQVNGAITSTSNITDSSGKSMADMRSSYNAHAHGGVQSGGDTSGGTNTPI